jgi:glycosyltransferase involved in cell wall biosynthesis
MKWRPPERPLVSVIIPCRNEAEGIEGCLASVLAQEEPEGGFEVIIADGMSEDGTREVVERLQTTDHKTTDLRLFRYGVRAEVTG